jgi:hypothetical protein
MCRNARVAPFSKIPNEIWEIIFRYAAIPKAPPPQVERRSSTAKLETNDQGKSRLSEPRPWGETPSSDDYLKFVLLIMRNTLHRLSFHIIYLTAGLLTT